MSTTTNPVKKTVHVPPPPAEKLAKKRRKLMFFDRAKLLITIAVFLGFVTAKKVGDLPILGYREAFVEQLQAKRWLVIVAGLELVRQLYNVLCERNAAFNHFWSWKFFGGWDRFWTRRDQWLRYRLGRTFRMVMWGILLSILFGYLWGVSPLQAFVESPSRVWSKAFSSGGELPLIVGITFTLILSVGQFVAIFWFMSKGGVDTYMPDEIETRFTDVWGQDRVLEKVKENIAFLENPEEIEAKGGHVPSGILLWGPPGTGKTLIAKAVAGETGKPYVFVDPGAFQAMFFGVGIMKVKALYRKLRKLALRHGGVIVFFDEADSLGNRGGAVAGREAPSSFVHSCNGLHYVSQATASSVIRGAFNVPADTSIEQKSGRIRQLIMGGGAGGGGMGTLQALLTEISGLEKPRGFLSRRLRKYLNIPGKKPPKYRILMMMATNLPDALDEALLRPGRLDRIYKVDYPSLEGRMRTYDGYLNKVKHEITEDELKRITLMSPRGTGANIKDIVNESLIVAMKDKRDTVTWPDLLKAKQLKTHGIPDEVHSVQLERHAVALHEASHAVAMKLLKKFEMIDVATIEPRGPVGGFVAPVPTQQEGFPWRYLQEDEIITFLASLAGERHFYDGDNSVGVGGDMRASTSIAMAMEGYAAMGGTLASHGVLPAVDGDKIRTTFNERVEERLQQLYARAQHLIAENEIMVLAVGHALETHHTISGDDVDAIFAGSDGPLVDGAWYHTEEFRVAYRRYHDLARQAHRDQIPFLTPLPIPGQVILMDRPLEPALHALPAIAERSVGQSENPETSEG